MIKSLLESNTISSLELYKQFLNWIEQHNLQGLGIRSIIAGAPRDGLSARAEELDNERQRGRARGTLHGIPIVVKLCCIF